MVISPRNRYLEPTTTMPNGPPPVYFQNKKADAAPNITTFADILSGQHG